MIWVLQELYCELKKFFWSDLRQHIVGRRTRGYLLYGPQGSGKKFLAECIAGVSWSFALLIQAVTGNSIMRHVVCSWNRVLLGMQYALETVLSSWPCYKPPKLENYTFWTCTHFGCTHNTTHTHTHTKQQQQHHQQQEQWGRISANIVK